MERNQSTLVPLVALANEFEAANIVGLLRAEGIPARIVGGFTSGFRAEAPGDVQVIVFREELDRARALLAEIAQENEADRSAAADGDPLPADGQHDSADAQRETKQAFQYGLATLLILQTAVAIVLAVCKVLTASALGGLILTGLAGCAMLYAIVAATVQLASDLERGRFLSRAVIVVSLAGFAVVELMLLLSSALD